MVQVRWSPSIAESHNSDRGPGILIHYPHLCFTALGLSALTGVRPPYRPVIDQGLPKALLTDNNLNP
jgi:hypothetical protein